MSATGNRLSLRRGSGSSPKRTDADGQSRADARRKPQVAALPSVNLLSPWAFERIGVRRLRIRFAIGCLALVLIAAGAWAVQAARVSDAESLLSVEKADTDRLTERTNVLQPVKTFVAGVDQQKATITEAMSSEIYFSRVLEALSDAAPGGLRLDSLVVTLAPRPVPVPAPAEGEDEVPAPLTASPCPGPDPFQTQVVIGCITLSGNAGSRSDVGAFVVALGTDDTFVEPFISTTTTADAENVTFSGSVGLSEKAFSGRYAQLDRLLDEKD